VSAQKTQHLARLRMPAKDRLLKHGRAVDGHLEPSAAAGLQRDVGVRKLFANRGRQTGGPGFVVSNDAELDVDVHRSSCGAEI
jgi:hypothetical protein